MEEFITLFSQADTWISLGSLFLMLMVLDIDNVIFISVLTTKLPKEMQPKARMYGLYIGMALRIGLLLLVDVLVNNQLVVFSVLGEDMKIKDLILIGGGLFLLAKSTLEIHDKLEGPPGVEDKKLGTQLGKVLVQLAILNLVFSMDSVITAVGMVKHKSVMVIAIFTSMLLMFIFAKRVGDYVHKHPTLKMLALSFLLLIGMLLVVEGIHQEVPKGYIYFAMSFSLFVEMLNLKVRRKYKVVELRDPVMPEEVGE